MNGEEATLTHEGRQAIRSYMMKLVAIPATIALIVSFFLGYFIHDVAEKNAYYNAYSKYLEAFEENRDKLIKLVVETTQRRSEVESLMKASVSEASNLQNILRQAKKLQGDLERTHANATAVYSVESFTNLGSKAFEALAQDANFVSAVAKETNAEVQNITATLKQAGDEWGSLRGEHGYGFEPWRHEDRSVSCPEGSYVSGVRIRYSGTCQQQCDADGGIVREILLTCHSVFG